MDKINLFNTKTGEKVQSLDTRGKFTLSIAYVSLIKEKVCFNYNLEAAHIK